MASKTQVKPFGGNLNQKIDNNKHEFHSVLGIFDDQEMHQSNVHLRGDDHFMGPSDDRKCTNILFLSLFLALSGLFVASSAYSITEGDVGRLYRGFDFRSEICGLGDLSHKRFMLYPDPSSLTWTLCVKSCPYYYLQNYYCIYDTDHATMLTEWGCFHAYATTAYGFYCVPAESEQREKMINFMLEPLQMFRLWSGSIILSWDLILLGFGASVVFGLFIIGLFALTKSLRRIIWVSVFTVIACGSFLVYAMIATAQKTRTVLCEDYGPAHPEYCDTRMETFYYCCAILSGILTLVFCIQVLKRKESLGMALEMMRLTKKPLKALKGIYAFTTIQVILGSGFVGLLVAVFCYNVSMGSVILQRDGSIPGGAAKKLDYNQQEKWFFTFTLIMSFWWLCFMVKLGEYSMAGGVSTWFFTRHKYSLFVSFTQFPIYRAFYRSVKYHSGSIALDTMLRPILFFPVCVLSYFHGRIMRARQPLSRFTRLMLRLFICIKVYEKCLRYFTSHTYIFVYITQIAIFGEDFWNSSKRTFFLSQRNRLRIERPNELTSFFLSTVVWAVTLVGVCVTCGTILLLDESLMGQQTVEIVTPTGPFLISGLLCWYIGKVYGGALMVTAKTLLFAAICDEEMFTREQRYCQDDLIEYLDGIGEEQNEFHRDDHIKVVMRKNNEDDSTLLNDNTVNTSRGTPRGPLSPMVPLSPREPSPQGSMEDDLEIIAMDYPEIRAESANSRLSATSAQSNRSRLQTREVVDQERNVIKTIKKPVETVAHVTRVERPQVFMQTIEEEDSFIERSPKSRIGRQARFVDN